MTQEQLILFKRSLNIYNTEIEAWTALDNLIHTQGQPVVAFFRRTSNTHGDTALGAIFAIGTDNGVGKYKACSSHDDMLAVAQALNTHISEWTAFKDTFDKMFEYDANHKAIKAKLDFYTDSNKNISAGGLGGSGSSSLGALYQLVDVMINSTGDGVEGAVEGSVLAYDATAGKWKAIAQSEILPDMSGYYTKEETNAAINAIPIYSIAKLSASDIAGLSDGTNVREAYRLKKGGSNVDDTVIKIYKDSAIKSLELRDNKYLVLTYTDNEGNEQSISKDLSVIVNDNYVDLINNQEIGGIKTFTEKTLFKKDINVLGDAVVGGEVAAIVSDGTPAGVTDYSALTGKPSINGKELASGNNTLDELGIQPKGDYTTASQLATTLENYATKVFVSNNYATKAAVNTIQALIPATASADNQLADKDFVNSSIATATAEFRGSFTSLDELKATSGNLNDYAFYLHTDSVGNSVVDRYKWTTAGWLYEYTLNNSSFTAEQWAALNSAITATLVQSYNSHLKNSTIHITSDERIAWNNKWDYNEETIKAVKVNAASSADYASSAGDADTLDGYHASSFYKHATASPDGSSKKPWHKIATFSQSTVGLNINTSITFYVSEFFYTKSYGIFTVRARAEVDSASPSFLTVDFLVNAGIYKSNIVATWKNTGDGNIVINVYAYRAGWSSFSFRKIEEQAWGVPQDKWTTLNASGGNENCYASIPSDENQVVSTNIDINNNVASATKLQDDTAFTAWGQTFFENGKPKNVSGDLIDVGNITASGKATIQGDIVCGGEVVAVAGEGTPAGVTDYSALTGKPAINGVTLVSGNNTLVSLGIQPAGDYATNSGVTTLLADYTTKTFVANNYAGKSAFNSHIADTNIHITSAERADWNAKWDYNEATIKAVKVTSASSADSVAWAGISGKPTTFTPSAHTHIASDVSGLPTSLKNPYALSFGSKTYDGSAAATITASDLGALTSITKSMVEGVLTGDITSHTHTFASLTSKPTTISGYGITDAITTGNIGSQSVNYATSAGNADTLDGKHNGELTAQYFSSGTMLTHNDTINRVLSGIYSYVNADNPTGSIGNNCILVAFRNRGRTDNLQIVGTANDRTLYYRIASNIGSPEYEKWTAWRELIHSDNYNKYAPTLTGTGASGTWGISITGNAATATNADTLDGYHASSFYKHATASPNGSSKKPWHKIATFSQSTVGLNINTSITFYVSEFFYTKSYGIFTVRARAEVDSASPSFLTVDFLVNAGIYKSNIVATWKNTGDGNIVINVYAYRAGWSSFSFRKIEEQAWGVPQDKWTTLNASGGNENCYASIPSDENQVVSTNIDINNNVASATKLQDDTAYTAWGQTFFENGKPKNVNGDAHITGDLIVDGEVSALVA